MWMVLTHWTVSFIRQHPNVTDVTERDVAGVMANLANGIFRYLGLAKEGLIPEIQPDHSDLDINQDCFDSS
jgi:hypothetical protein